MYNLSSPTKGMTGVRPVHGPNLTHRISLTAECRAVLTSRVGMWMQSDSSIIPYAVEI